MFDKQYFEQHMRTQLEQLDSARASVFLHNGTQLQIARIDEAFNGYVLLQVYPKEGVNDKTREQRRKPEGTDEVFWDRVAIAYESIGYVWLSITEREQETRMGFGV